MPDPNPIRALPERDAVAGPPPSRRDEPPPPDPSDPGHGTPYVGPPYNGLPPGSPIEALGHKDNEIYYFLAPNGGLKPIRDEKFTKNKLLSLYNGSLAYLVSKWPRFGKKGDITGFDADECNGDHMMACVKAGPFDPVNSMRGAGAWRATDRDHSGALVWNFGDTVLVKPRDGREFEAPSRRIGYHIYQLRPPMLRPGPEASGTPAAAKELVKSLGTWSWARPELDPLLFMGWIVAAMMGGALTWRPLIWITGEKGTGKSTLEGRDGYFDHIFGPEGVALSTNATAAGIYQKLGFDSRPVALDEMEAKADNKKSQAILDIAMQACSGGVTLRGGADHSGIAFESRSAFAFSSINIPPLNSALLSRMGILELGPLGRDRSGILAAEKLFLIGCAFRRRIVDLWEQWDDRFASWHKGLMDLGHPSRTADQFGTLLAAAHLMLDDKPKRARDIDTLLADWNMKHLAEQADESPDWQACLAWLLTKPLSILRGMETTVARQMEIALGRGARVDHDVNAAMAQQRTASDALTHLGLKLVQRPDPDRDGRDAWFLAIANDVQGTARIFDGSHWAGSSGSVPVFVKTLRRVPRAVWGEKHGVTTLHFNGHHSRVTLLPLDIVLPGDEAAERPPL